MDKNGFSDPVSTPFRLIRELRPNLNLTENKMAFLVASNCN